MLISLLTNVMKYSPHAEQIIARLTSTAECLTVSVQDFGIAESEHKKVFEWFHRVCGERHRTAAGLGVELFIAHQIIEHYSRKLWVESIEGQESPFSFSLPRRSP